MEYSARRTRDVTRVGVLLLAVALAAIAYWTLRLAPGTSPSGGPPSAGARATSTPPSDVASSGTGPATPGEAQPLPTLTANPQLPLLGRRISLDPGHGPREDMGAVLLDEATHEIFLTEAEFNLDVAQRTRNILTARGASVVLTRESADTFTIPWPADVNGNGEAGDYGDDLQARVDIANNFKAEVFLSIHANAGNWDSTGKKEVQVIYCGTPDCNSPAENESLGHLVLDRLQARLAEATSGKYGGQLLLDLDTDSSDPPQHLFVLGPANAPRHMRAIAMPAILAESLYVTAPEHAAQLNRNSVRQAIALAYADALQAYLTGAGKQQ